MWALIIIIAVLLILFVLLCRYIGKNFMKNLHRINPGEKFKADIDVSFYQNSPLRAAAEKGLEHMESLPREDVYIESFDGLKLHAYYFPAPGEPANIVLGIHGFQSKALNEYAPYIGYYHSMGFSMLLPDDRAHGLSEGEYITMGVKDRFDCISWAKYLVERFGENVRILLHGVSMGAATVLSASGEEELPEQVFGAVSDCGYTSVQDQLELQLKTVFNMPSAFPISVCRWYAKHRAGFDPDEARPIEQVTRARIPILFVQGSEDFLVPADMAKRLYAACSSEKRLLIVEGASHAESIALEPESYHRAIEEFFKISAPAEKI